MTTMKTTILLLLALVLAGCAAGAALPTPGPSSPSPGVPSGPPDSPGPGSPPPDAPIPPIESAEEAIAAVAAEYPEFLGYKPLDPDIIGASAWVEVDAGEDVIILTFVRGSGDCQAGCIDRAYARFEVHIVDGTVIKLCEWQEGSQPIGTPC